jgi:hypothetical protein
MVPCFTSSAVLLKESPIARSLSLAPASPSVCLLQLQLILTICTGTCRYSEYPNIRRGSLRHEALCVLRGEGRSCPCGQYRQRASDACVRPCVHLVGPYAALDTFAPIRAAKRPPLRTPRQTVRSFGRLGPARKP